MKLIRTALCYFLFAGFTAAANPVSSPNASFVSKVACSSWSDLEASTRFSSNVNRTQIQQIHGRLRNYLRQAEDQLAQAAQTDDIGTIILTCATVEDLTAGFTKPCRDQTGKEFVSHDFIDFCQSMHK